MKGRVLIVAGSDSGGGAGIQADIKTVTVLGGFAMTAITALTAQNTLGVHDILPVPAAFVGTQIDCVLDDLGADSFKIGMLGDPALIECVADRLGRHPETPLVLDPVMVAKGGQPLLAASAVSALKRSLLPLAALLTPNLPEASVLCGRAIETEDDMRHAADMLLTLGVPAVLLKGGHLPGDVVTDMLATEDGITLFSAPRIESRHTHGTGCTLASAIATGLAQGMALQDAVDRGRTYTRRAIETAPGFGAGAGPLNHATHLLAD
ncbi:bifunctional hydroxymethylpyrimidine kinase/phosphomethylpyrimidine kinase [Acetobacteraceae bacterium KSS8]|uniref:hydroxymethylpyrimidine kinase n=1 Tax=Endosaccharibacter trunci TaxID=2812733 RepID=A0ABT1WA96_9PROT|nr:bifunctional hydroxymethylpyrimidine kinase/phosphomethylpyrimidine kinase [Acetobacteraceae bacterium KSS8]